MILLFLLFALTCGVHVEPKNETETTPQKFDFGRTGYQNETSPLLNTSASVFKNYSNANSSASIVRALDFYNTEVLRSQWENIQINLTSTCQNDMEQYIQGLNSAKTWALKMEDASGRYSTGWFWGNTYWTGSQNLCDNIAPKNKQLLFKKLQTNQEERKANASDSLRKTASPSQALGYKPGRLDYTSVPPFQLAFFVLKINLNSAVTTDEKIIHVGLCLPKSCSDGDVENIFEETAKTSPFVKVQISNIRSPHKYWNIWDDTTFRILCVTTTLVVMLLISGTSYDFYLERLTTKEKRLAMNCTTYCNSNKYDSSTKLDVIIPEVKAKNEVTYSVANAANSPNNSPVLTSPRKRGKYAYFIRSIAKDVLLAFSVRINLKTICDQSVGSDTIPVVHGLKTISMVWVILGHTCIIAFKYSDNMEYRKVVQQEFLFQTIANGAFSVDTFFFTSGLLVSFLYFRTNAKGKLDTLTQGLKGLKAGSLHFIGLILYRFARLTAPYLFVVGVVEVCMKWFNYNSVFEPPTSDHINCPKYWWRNILYINTLFPVEEMCMLWSWYLSDDTQFYVVGAVMLILATSHFKSAAALLLTFMMSSWITTAYVAYSNSHIPNPDDPMALFDKIYDKPWTRLGPYLIGMSVGWLLFKTDCRIRMSKLTVIVGWLTSTACLLSLVYGLYEADLSPISGAAYSSLSHSAWAIGLAWIVVACSTGHGGLANTILSTTILYPLSRVTYCAYLLHPLVIRAMIMSMDSPLHLGSFVMVIIFLGQVAASYILSFFVSLAFEAPVVSMLRILTKLSPANRMKSTNES